MLNYRPTKAEKKIQRSALLITIAFYTLLFGLLILGYQEDLVDAFPDSIMNLLDGWFEQETVPPPQASML